METIEQLYEMLLWGSMAFLALAICGTLGRAILGPRFTDRIVAIDVVSSLATLMIMILAYLMHDGGLLDIALIYAIVGFLSVVVLSKTYLLPYHDRISDKGRNPVLLHLPDEDSEELYG